MAANWKPSGRIARGDSGVNRPEAAACGLDSRDRRVGALPGDGWMQADAHALSRTWIELHGAAYRVARDEVSGLPDYLARRFPATNLLPEGDAEAEGQVVAWISFLAATVNPARARH
jgi:hypothetical protein